MKIGYAAGVAALALVIALPTSALAARDCTKDTQTCLDDMAARLTRRGYMGLEFDRSDAGLYTVKRVVEGAPAAAAGFRPGDAILIVNGARWSDADALKKLDWSVGSRMSVKVLRGDEKIVLHLTLGRMPEDLIARTIGMHMLENHVTPGARANRN